MVVLPALVRVLLNIVAQGSVVVDEGALQVSEVSGVYFRKAWGEEWIFLPN